MTRRIFAAAILALFSITAPAHAALVESLDANLNINYGPNDLTGTIDIIANPNYASEVAAGAGAFAFPYFLSEANLSVNGTPLEPAASSIPVIALGVTGLAWFIDPNNNLHGFSLSSVDLPPNPTYQNFLLSGLPDSVSEPSGGTVTVTSETLSPVPLPDTLPMFGAALLALGGFAACRSRRAPRA